MTAEDDLLEIYKRNRGVGAPKQPRFADKKKPYIPDEERVRIMAMFIKCGGKSCAETYRMVADGLGGANWRSIQTIISNELKKNKMEAG